MSTSPTLTDKPELNGKAERENGHDLKEGTEPGEENSTPGKVPAPLIEDTQAPEEPKDTDQTEGTAQTEGDVIQTETDPAIADAGASSTQNGSAEKTEDMDTTDSNLQPEDEKQDDATQDENGVEEKDNSVQVLMVDRPGGMKCVLVSPVGRIPENVGANLPTVNL